MNPSMSQSQAVGINLALSLVRCAGHRCALLRMGTLLSSSWLAVQNTDPATFLGEQFAPTVASGRFCLLCSGSLSWMYWQLP